MNELNTREEFEIWLFEMDNALDDLFELFKEKDLEELKKYSLDSLNIIEEWLLIKFNLPDEILEKSNKIILDSSSRFIGEVIRKKVSGKWSIELKDKDDAYFGIPVIVSKDEKHFFDCPHSLTTALLDRREKQWLKGVVEYIIDI